MPTYVQLPANLCAERNTNWKTLYWTEYCDRAKQKLLPKRKPKKTALKSTGNLPLNRTFMKDHYPEYGHLQLQKDYEATLVTLGKQLRLKDRTNERISSPVLDHKNNDTEDQLLSKTLPSSMNAVEKSWMTEVHTNKRERGNIYGAAGKKPDLSRPKSSPQIREDTMPGLDTWLETANENEKQVVYTFLDSVSRSIDENQHNIYPEGEVDNGDKGLSQSKQVRVSSAPARVQRYTPVPSTRGSSRSSNSSRGSQRGNRLTLDFPQNNETPRSAGTPPRKDDLHTMRRAKSEVTFRELSSPVPEQKPLSARSSRSSNSRDTQRSKSTHKHCHSHSETSCTKCRDNLIKSMIKDIEGDDVSPFDPNFPGMATPNRNRFYNTSAYYAYDPEDYVHQHSLFTNAPKGNRGYFIIHPDWVSEFSQHRPSYR